MDTTNKTWMQLSVFAVAVLVIVAVAVAAVSLTAGPTEAHVTVDSNQAQVNADAKQKPRTGDNAEEYKKYGVIPCSEEAQPDASTARVKDSGHYPVFDAFWDYEVGHMSNNFCPPSVEHTTQTHMNEETGEETTVPVNTRTDANIHISETAFSIPDRYKVTVVDSDETNGNPSTATEPKIDLANYPFLRGAVSAVKPGPDSTPENPTTVFANNSLWWVKAENVPANTDANTPLILGFSTDLLEEADWYLRDGPDAGTEPDPPVQIQFVAVHVLRAGTWQETHVVGAHFFAFHPGASQSEPQWSSFDTQYNTVQMFTDQYRHMQYVFTDPGMYRVQAHVQGNVRKERNRLRSAPEKWSPISPDDTVTSPAEWYTFHVGPEADLGVTLTHTDETSGDDATTVTDGTASFSVAATNTGPHTAENTVVEVSLPVGLEYSIPDPKPANVDYACGVISWKVGDLTASGASSSSTLTFTANVQTGAPKSLAVDAEVHSSTVDDNEANNTASANVLLSSTVVRPPFFGGATRHIVEHAIVNAHAGNPVAANNPDGRPLDYSLTGRCHEWFGVHDETAQIFFAGGENVSLDYDEQSEFHLTLHVSDGVTDTGATDAAKSADDGEPVTVRVIDTPDDAVHPTVTFTLSNPDPQSQPNLDLDRLAVGDRVDVNAQVNNLPDGATPTYTWDFPPDWTGAPVHTSFYPAGAFRAGPETYTVHIKWDGGGITASYTINWVAASS